MKAFHMLFHNLLYQMFLYLEENLYCKWKIVFVSACFNFLNAFCYFLIHINDYCRIASYLSDITVLHFICNS